jgi:transcriptional regulator with XRE-family HTH domain
MHFKRILDDLGNKIRCLRKEREMTQEQLGEKASMHRTYIADIERGRRNVSVMNLCTMATVFGMNVADLFDGIDTQLSAGEKRIRKVK